MLLLLLLLRFPRLCYARKPVPRKKGTTLTGSDHSCRTLVMLCCCLRSAKLGQSSMRCFTVWGLAWQSGHKSVWVLSMRCLYVFSDG